MRFGAQVISQKRNWTLNLGLRDYYYYLMKIESSPSVVVFIQKFPFAIYFQVTATLTLAAASSSAGIAVLLDRDLGLCITEHDCPKYQTAVAFAFLSWGTTAISAVIMFWILGAGQIFFLIWVLGYIVNVLYFWKFFFFSLTTYEYSVHRQEKTRETGNLITFLPSTNFQVLVILFFVLTRN